jgi:hypothetical protein
MPPKRRKMHQLMPLVLLRVLKIRQWHQATMDQVDWRQQTDFLAATVRHEVKDNNAGTAEIAQNAHTSELDQV